MATNNKEKIIKGIVHVLEVILALIVLVSVLISMVKLYQPFVEFIYTSNDDHAFIDFLGRVLTIVIGLEFFKVLYRPNINVLLEVLIFVMARHMIVYENSALDELLSIIGICLLTGVKYYIFHKKEIDEQE